MVRKNRAVVISSPHGISSNGSLRSYGLTAADSATVLGVIQEAERENQTFVAAAGGIH